MAQCLAEVPLFGSFTLFSFFVSPFSSATVSPLVTCSTSVFWLQDTCHLPATAIGCNSRGRNCRRNSYTEVRTHPTLAFPPDHRDRGSPGEKQGPAGVYILLTLCKTCRQSVVAGLTWLAWENWGKSKLIHWMRKSFRWREERWVLCREQFTRRRPLAPLMPPLPPDFSPVNGRRRWTGPRMGGAWDLSPTTRHHHRAARWIDQSLWWNRGALKQVAIVLQTFSNFCAIILVACSLFMSKIRCGILTKVKHATAFPT